MEFEIEEFDYNVNNLQNEEIETEKQRQQKKQRMIVSYQRKDMNMIKRITEDCNFMIASDIFLWKDAFSSYYQEESIGFCPLNKYRPPQSTYLNKNFGYTIHEESYDGFINPNEIECICNILESLQIDKAYQVAQFVKKVILPKQKANIQLKQQILDAYSNNEIQIKELLENNFQRSLSLAHSFLLTLSDDSNRVIKYQIKKFSLETMSHKIYSNGGSEGLARLIQGDYTFIKQNYQSLLEYLMFYCKNIQLPEILDQRGLIDINIAMIQGIKEIDLTILTIEGFSIRGKCRILQYPLSEVTLINNYSICDQLVVLDFIFNPNILIDLRIKREEIDRQLLNGEIEYNPFIDSFYSQDKMGRVMEGIDFMKKFYPDKYEKMKQKFQQKQIALKQQNIQSDEKEYQLENNSQSNDSYNYNMISVNQNHQFYYDKITQIPDNSDTSNQQISLFPSSLSEQKQFYDIHENINEMSNFEQEQQFLNFQIYQNQVFDQSDSNNNFIQGCS